MILFCHGKTKGISRTGAPAPYSTMSGSYHELLQRCSQQVSNARGI
jgi:hypothetical protein